MRKIKCCLCGRAAFTWPSAGGLDVAYPELMLAVPNPWGARATPLCEECTLSALYQGALMFSSDAWRLLDE